jgi:hypothetical protein
MTLLRAGRGKWRWVALGFGLAATMTAQPQPPAIAPVVPELRRVAALPVAAEAAAKAGVPFAGIAPDEARTGLHKGDSVTALVTHIDGGKTRQWIVFLKANPPEETEKTEPPAGLTMYSTSGRELRIPGKANAIAIRVLGPFSESLNGSKKAKDRWSGALVNETYLELGLDRACALMMRLEKLARTMEGKMPENFGIGFGTRPFPVEQRDANRAVMDQLGITEEDERALMGSFPAMVSFFHVILQTQGLDEILRSVVDISWVSLIKSGGNLVPNFQYLNPFTELPAGEWGLSKQERCYSLKFQLSLNGKPALNCQMAVTSARPPLLTSAGIVGLAAQRPDGKGPLLLMQVIDARCVKE